MELHLVGVFHSLSGNVSNLSIIYVLILPLNYSYNVYIYFTSRILSILDVFSNCACNNPLSPVYKYFLVHYTPRMNIK